MAAIRSGMCFGIFSCSDIFVDAAGEARVKVAKQWGFSFKKLAAKLQLDGYELIAAHDSSGNLLHLVADTDGMGHNFDEL